MVEFVHSNIGKIAEIVKTGKTPPTSKTFYFNGEINWYTPGDLDKVKFLGKSIRTLTTRAIEDNKAVILPKGTVLIGGIGEIGKTGILSDEASFNQQITGIVPFENKVLSEYLYYWIIANKKLIQSRSKKAVVPILNNAYLKTIPISYPNIEYQTRVIQVLEKAEKLIHKRKQTNNILDELVKSVFLEMFGDPHLNTKEWELVKISSFVEKITAGWSANGEQRRKNEDEFGVLKVSAVTSGFFKPEEHKAIKKSKIEKSLIHPQKGDVLFSRANTKELVAATCIIDEDYYDLFLPDKLWRIELNKDKVQAHYFKFVFSNSGYRRNLARKATGSSGSMLNISQQKFKNHLFPKPPVEFQKEFERIAEFVVSKKRQLLDSLGQSEILFRSLLQKTFRGELEFIEENVAVQNTFDTLRWYQEQLKHLEKTRAIAQQQQKIADAVNQSGIVKSVQAVHEIVNRLHLPALENIKSFQKIVNSFKIPSLDYIKTFEQFQIVKDSSTQLGIADNFSIPAFKERQEEERLEKIKEELSRENDPVLIYISETQAGKISFGNYEVNMPRFIHEEFKGQEFSFEEIINRLGDNYGLVNVNKENVKKELFRSFKVLLRIEYKDSAFTFNGLSKKLKEKLFNPSYELLHEFIVDELQDGKEIRQAFFTGSMYTDYPEQYKKLKYSNAPFRLYLIHTNGNS